MNHQSVNFRADDLPFSGPLILRVENSDWGKGLRNRNSPALLRISGIHMPAPKDYIERMDRTFDSLTEAVRAEQPAAIFAVIIFTILRKFATGIAIGCGIAVGLAIARAGVGL